MTLYESKDGLEKLNSNGIMAYIDPKLKEFLDKTGDINVDYIANETGQGGFAVQVGEKNCGDCQCSGSQQ